jgi:hypothetical protein
VCVCVCIHTHTHTHTHVQTYRIKAVCIYCLLNALSVCTVNCWTVLIQHNVYFCVTVKCWQLVHTDGTCSLWAQCCAKLNLFWNFSLISNGLQSLRAEFSPIPAPAVPQNAVCQSLSTITVSARSPFVLYWQVSTDRHSHRCPKHSGCPGECRRSLRYSFFGREKDKTDALYINRKWVYLTQDKKKWRAFVNRVVKFSDP